LGCYKINLNCRGDRIRESLVGSAVFFADLSEYSLLREMRVS
jgi:hypothetical protein